MLDQADIIRGTTVAILLGLYGIYLIAAGLMIVWKKKEILNPAESIRIFLMKLSVSHQEMVEYEHSLKAGKNWPRVGKLMVVYGFALILGSIFIWGLVH